MPKHPRLRFVEEKKDSRNETKAKDLTKDDNGMKKSFFSPPTRTVISNSK